MSSDIDIVSNALLLIGDEPISAFTEAGAGATIAANLYPQTYAKMLSEHPWSFAFKEQQLSRLSAVPDSKTNYSYAFQLPTDLIRLWAILPNSRYEIIGSLLYSNETELLARYIYKPDENDLPPHFVEALQYKLASDFAISVTEDRNKAQYYAELTKMATAKAKNVDSQGRPQTPVISSPFISSHYGARY